MRNGLWTSLIAGLSVIGSLAFACATPFAAIGALAASKMDRRQGLMLVVAAWLSNQIVGFGILGYPQTARSTWGAAIGLAAVLAYLGSRAAASVSESHVLRLTLTFLVAFGAYELALAATGVLLPIADDAFSAAVVARILEINFLSFVGLLALHQLAVTFRLLPATAKAIAPRAV